MTHGISGFIQQARHRSKRDRSSKAIKEKKGPAHKTPRAHGSTSTRWDTFVSGVRQLRGRLPWKAGQELAGDHHQHRLTLPGQIILAAGRRPSSSVLHADNDDVSELDLNAVPSRRGSSPDSRDDDDDDTIMQSISPKGTVRNFKPRVTKHHNSFAPKRTMMPRDTYLRYPEWLLCSYSFHQDGRWFRTKDQDENTNMFKLPLKVQSKKKAPQTPQRIPERAEKQPNAMDVDSDVKSFSQPRSGTFRKWRSSASLVSNIIRTASIGKGTGKRGGCSSLPDSETFSTGTAKGPRKNRSCNFQNEEMKTESLFNQDLYEDERRCSSGSEDLTLHRVMAHGNSRSPSPDRARQERFSDDRYEEMDDLNATRVEPDLSHIAKGQKEKTKKQQPQKVASDGSTLTRRFMRKMKGWGSKQEKT